MDYRFNIDLQEMIAAEVGSQEAALSAGSAEDYADYRYRVGIIRGLHLASEFSTEIKRKILGETT